MSVNCGTNAEWVHRSSRFKLGDKVIYTGSCANPHYGLIQHGACPIVVGFSTRFMSGRSIPLITVRCSAQNFTLAEQNFTMATGRAVGQAAWDEIFLLLDAWNLKHGRTRPTPESGTVSAQETLPEDSK